MPRVRTLVAIGVSALAMPLAASRGQQATARVDSTKLYHQLLAKFSTGDTTLTDVNTLRFAYAASDDYQPMPDLPSDWKSQIIRTASMGDAKKAAKIADRIVALDPLNLEAYVLRAGVRQQASDPGGAKQDGARARALYASILSTGDGSRDHPWVVIAIAEEYYVLMVQGLHRTDQVLSTCAGHPCDQLVLDGTDKAGRAALYFDVSIPMRFEEKMLKTP
jgi:hypothetical protein